MKSTIVKSTIVQKRISHSVSLVILSCFLFVIAAGGDFANASGDGESLKGSFSSVRNDFIHPPDRYKTCPLWFWNAPLDAKTTEEIMQRSAESGYNGFGILPGQGMTPAFMTPEFLEQYRIAIEKAERLGFQMCLYDEYWFPSGSAGGALVKQYPEALSQRLDMKEIEAQGNSTIQETIPPGKLMSAVAMNTQTLERINLSSFVKDATLTWKAPEGTWKVMLFTCVLDGSNNLVDYLEPESVKKYISLTYDKYYEALSPHFGKTIDTAFYDEPTMHWIPGGRAWTPAFNDKFQKRYGFDPAPYYPALWFDIGADTAAARNALFGFRAELYADGFIKTLQEWCRDRKIQLTGHQDQEEIVNPVGLCGDLMKAFRDQDIPGIDQIFAYGRASKAYKIVSSAAYNYDRSLVMTECYGAIKDMPIANLYKEAMDQFAKGINWMVPHAVWYDPSTIVFPPELSYRSPVYGPALPAYNEYMARLQRILQQGRHVADIAVLYPIATLQAGYRFGVGKPYEGGIIPPEADYMDVGEMLSLQVRRDFTYLHPDVLDEKCRVVDNEIQVNNQFNREKYRVLVIPGSQAISLSSLQKIQQFYDNGGKIISTTLLPAHSAEFGKDSEVQATIAAIFGDGKNADSQAKTEVPKPHINGKGGKAYFISNPSPKILKAVLDDAVTTYDVSFEDDVQVQGGNLSYIHKVIDGRDIYFFANSSEIQVDCFVQLRAGVFLEEWNPHTGEIQKIDCVLKRRDSEFVTRFRLILPPVQSRFYIASDMSGSVNR